MLYKFNIYYSTSVTGPWILANETPLDPDPTGYNMYNITGLQSNTVYYIQIVGGVMVDGEFSPLMSQSIGPVNQGAVTDINQLALRS